MEDEDDILFGNGNFSRENADISDSENPVEKNDNVTGKFKH